MTAEESHREFRSGYRPPPFYAVSVRLRAARDRRVFSNISDVEDAAKAARAIALALGGLAVEQTVQPHQSRRLSNWLSVMAIIGTLLLMILIMMLASSE